MTTKDGLGGAVSGEPGPVDVSQAGPAGAVLVDATGNAGLATPLPTRPSKAGVVWGAVQVSYVYQALVLVSGLLLTRFLLSRLGEHDYGLWAVGTQIVAWMYLMDLGVVALLPRETAYVLGEMHRRERGVEVRRVIDRTFALVLWQLPLVALVALCVWLLLPTRWEPLAGPLAIVFTTFVLGFPLRVLPAALQGLQDLVYVAAQTLVGWVFGLVVTIALVALGAGLYGLAAGWVVVQGYQFAAAWVRLRSRHREVLPTGLTPLRWPAARKLLMSGTWVSVAQIAQVLVTGTDVLIVGWVLGPLAVTAYAITAKLVTVLANQPQLIMQIALPGVAEIRAGADMARLQRVASALSQAMLIASGLVFCVVLVANEPFVALWLPRANPYAGDLLTGLLLLVMLLRHWNFAAIYTLFALGGEKRISLTTLTDGLVTVLATLFLVPRFGVVGAPLGALIGVLFVSLPSNLIGVSRAAGTSVVEWVRPLLGWGWRFVALGTVAIAVSRLKMPLGILGLAGTVILASAVVSLVMAQVALNPPLGPYVRRRIPWLRAR